MKWSPQCEGKETPSWNYGFASSLLVLNQISAGSLRHRGGPLLPEANPLV